MEAIAKQGLEFLKREGSRIQKLLKEKVMNIYIYIHANSMMISAMLMLRE